MASVIYRLALLTPALYWAWHVFFGDLGAEPAKALNHMTGEVALYFLVLNLLIGALIALSFQWPRQLRFLVRHRRYLGIVTFLFLAFHLFLYLAMEAFEFQALEQMATKTYLICASMAWLILLVLALTSNNYSVRHLGGRRWKRVHRAVYVASFFITIHVMLIEKTDLLKYGAIFLFLWGVQGFRLMKWARQKKAASRGGKLAAKGG